MHTETRNAFDYVTYIRSTPEGVWAALTDPAANAKFWFGCQQKSEWKPGSPWQLLFENGGVVDVGEVLEADPGKRLVLKWRNEWNPELKAEGYSRCTITLEPQSAAVKVTLNHVVEGPGPKLIQAFSAAWPMVLSNLKSLLESGSIALSSYKN